MSFSQSGNLVGEYYFQAGTENEHLIQYSLTMNSDGTFLFHAYENHKKGIPWEKNQYGKGKWNLDGKVVSFFTDNEGDIDEKNTLDFSNSKARFISKPSRDKSDRVIETALQFFKSNIFWIERLKILKRSNALQQRL